MNFELVQYMKYMKYVKSMKGTYDEEHDTLRFVFPRLPSEMKNQIVGYAKKVRDVKLKKRETTVVEVDLTKLLSDPTIVEKVKALPPVVVNAMKQYMLNMGVPEKRLEGIL